jgi:glucose 1-dehydrogenase
MDPRRTDNSLLAGQRALVTGANTGVGAVIAQALAAAGAAVVVNYTSLPPQAERVVQQIKTAGGEAIAIAADVTEEDQVQAMFGKMFDTYGSIDILVNSLDVHKDSLFTALSLTDWEYVLRLNLTGQFLCAREAAREFIRRGVTPGISCSAGKIICLSSIYEVIPGTGQASYAVSKAGVHMLVRAMAQELAVHKIRVNSISPGVIKTASNHIAWATPEREAEILEQIPYGRLGQAGDVAQAAVWLASDASDYMTGTTLYVDGGMSLYHLFGGGI